MNKKTILPLLFIQGRIQSAGILTLFRRRNFGRSSWQTEAEKFMGNEANYFAVFTFTGEHECGVQSRLIGTRKIPATSILSWVKYGYMRMRFYF